MKAATADFRLHSHRDKTTDAVCERVTKQSNKQRRAVNEDDGDQLASPPSPLLPHPGAADLALISAFQIRIFPQLSL